MKRTQFSLFLLTLTFAAGCNPIGGECTFSQQPGQCRFTQVPADGGLVTFTFTLIADGGVTDASNAGYSAACLTSNGLAAGSTVACVRQEIASGTCTPIAYTFSTIDAGAAECR
jgi:hypothetical protein